jgi:hypothetical protein
MMRIRKSVAFAPVLVVLGTSLFLGVASMLFSQDRAEIHITQVPPRGSGPDRVETIAGTVKGVDFSQYKVLLYARTDKWYVQPYIDSPYTAISKDGRWRADTHLGSEYAALLVKSSHSNAAATANTLPPIGGDVAAIEQKAAK